MKRFSQVRPIKEEFLLFDDKSEITCALSDEEQSAEVGLVHENKKNNLRKEKNL